MRTLAAFCLSVALGATATGDLTVKRKFSEIEAGRLPAHSRVVLTYPELNAWAVEEVPAGVRNPQLRSAEPGILTGEALIDFGKLERSAGRQPGWFVSKLIDGERRVAVTVRLQSTGGQATVAVQRVEISGIVLDGRALDFLIQNFLIPMYPNAAISRPFDLGYNIERIGVAPAAVTVRLR